MLFRKLRNLLWSPPVTYVAHSMSGRTPAELTTETATVAAAAGRRFIPVLDPVILERVPLSKHMRKKLSPTHDTLAGHWARDKAAIRAAHVVFDVTGSRKSEGVAHEIGFARYCLYKPVVRLYPGLGESIARFEDDAIVETLDEGFELIQRLWGTRRKRFVWRLKMLCRSLPRWILDQILGWR